MIWNDAEWFDTHGHSSWCNDMLICKDMFCIRIHCHSCWCIRCTDMFCIHIHCHSCWCGTYSIRIEWIRIEWNCSERIEIEWVRFESIRIEWYWGEVYWNDTLLKGYRLKRYVWNDVFLNAWYDIDTPTIIWKTLRRNIFRKNMWGCRPNVCMDGRAGLSVGFTIKLRCPVQRWIPGCRSSRSRPWWTNNAICKLEPWSAESIFQLFYRGRSFVATFAVRL